MDKLNLGQNLAVNQKSTKSAAQGPTERPKGLKHVWKAAGVGDAFSQFFGSFSKNSLQKKNFDTHYTSVGCKLAEKNPFEKTA